MRGRSNNHKIVTISQMFSFQVTFSLPLPSLLLKLPIEKSRIALGKTFQESGEPTNSGPVYPQSIRIECDCPNESGFILVSSFPLWILSTQYAPSPGTEPRPHQWKEGVFTTALFSKQVMFQLTPAAISNVKFTNIGDAFCRRRRRGCLKWYYDQNFAFPFLFIFG